MQQNKDKSFLKEVIKIGTRLFYTNEEAAVSFMQKTYVNIAFFELYFIEPYPGNLFPFASIWWSEVKGLFTVI